MYIAQLSLTDFRGYANLDLTLSPGVTAFIGPNGHGKTNLVEAVGYLATQSSHRVARDAPLVRAGAERAIVRGDIVNRDRHAVVEVEINPGKANRARLNRSSASRPRDVLGIARTTLFAPEDLALVKGDPDMRRRFLDDLLVTRTPRLAGVRQDYDRVLRQRNTLLKTASGRRGGSVNASALATLEVWDAQLATAGGELLAGRLALCDALRSLVDEAYTAVAPGRGTARIDYRSSVPVADGEQAADLALTGATLAEALTAEITRRRSDELERGVSLVGPHRDDLDLRLGELPAKGYASHGESWSYALALRLASYELLRDDGAEPILILDDVFAELDTDRRARLAEVAARAEQVLLTAAVPADVPIDLLGTRYQVLEQEVRGDDGTG